MFYQVPDDDMDTVERNPKFLVDQLDLVGGVDFIFIEVCIYLVIVSLLV